MRHKHLGFGLIEIIVALGIFATLATTALTLSLNGFAVNRQSEEQALASAYASSGLEALRSIRNQSWSNLVNGTYGINHTSGYWSLAGSNDVNGKFTREISISNVQRDVSGNIIASGGVLDPDVKQITATVSWDFSPTRQNSVVQTTYLTNFQKPIVNLADAVLLYSDNTTTNRYRTYDTTLNTFSTASALPDGASAQNIVVRASPLTTEAIAGYVSVDGTLHVLCSSGGTWVEDWSASVGGTGSTRRFDLSYSTSSGQGLVVYSTNASGSNELAYRTKSNYGCGVGAWSASTNFDPQRTSGIVHWVKLVADLRSTSNTLALGWGDSNRDLSLGFWNGSTFVNEPTATTESNLEIVSTGQDSESFALAFESLSGNLMAIWGTGAGTNGTNGVRYRRCLGGSATCSWDNITTPPTFADDATNLSLSPHPTTNEMVFASIGNAGSDLQAGYWSGSAWTNRANLDTSCATPIGGSQKVTTGWLTSNGNSRSVISYSDQGSIRIDWVVGNAGTFTAQTDFSATPNISNIKNSLELIPNPHNNSTLLLLLADGSNSLYSKRLTLTNTTFTWDNSDGGAALEASLTSSLASPFGFAYWR